MVQCAEPGGPTGPLSAGGVLILGTGLIISSNEGEEKREETERASVYSTMRVVGRNALFKKGCNVILNPMCGILSAGSNKGGSPFVYVLYICTHIYITRTHTHHPYH